VAVPVSAATPAEFRQQLLAAGILAATAEDGLYARSDAFERVALAFDALVTRRATAMGATRWSFAPIQPRASLERTGYLASFPHLAGSVHVFTGNDRDHAEMLRRINAGEDWSSALSPAPTVLCSACCQPLYPLMSGRLPVGGRLVDVTGWCFRHEPSLDPCRMQAFRQHDVVYLGTSDGVRQHLDGWLDRGADLLESLGLEVQRVVASDPFFGRGGGLMSESMLSSELKHELIAAVASDVPSTALMSANEHRDHFSTAFGIELADGTPATTACIGFGLERVTLALLDRHGLDPAQWPAGVWRVLES
jgi:seryl-tRNA synthetase